MVRRISYNSPVILTFTLLCLIALLLGYMTKQATTVMFFEVYKGNLNDILFYFRLFGHVLGHTNWDHLVNNSLMILVLGPVLEEKYGPRRMFVMIAITALVTGVLNVLLTNTALLGASGIVFMLILLSSIVNIKKGKIPLTLILVVVIYMGREFANGLLIKDNISQFTHIIGGICGGAFGFIDK